MSRVIVSKFRNNFKKCSQFVAMLSGLLLLTMHTSFATTTDGSPMPWEGPLQKILASIQGPVAKILGVIVIIIAGLGIAFGESGGGMRKIFQIVFGLSIAFTATSVVTSLFGVTAGSVF
ncbi:conjugal transfer protein TrbC [Piscirickettsia salmonis]|uniref:Type IV secretion system protein VirB2 n=2 Tax=Piscirickettsia salmonis TaxID=1238 RepID=A0AAC8VKT8_PISSA|nr:type IV secretion system protein VirB2 [Piscirickettsia salmonis]QGN97185.1 conjugal transfer protein TrbC [Piscirickettsia salmonis]QGO00782.1 conjugal transfer protein TrbC [Piscirickettsia salmonis]QGO11506.1 conjugal transfer protein TrbC [Piscirickettsia salmonis]QGO18529.1 conjugal transfer protein TrbC [Piscirickettsia salmonis]